VSRLRLFRGPSDKYLVIINPVSRMGKGLRKALWTISRLVIRRMDFETVLTRTPGHAEEIVAGLDHHIDVVVAIGGDGTVQEIVKSKRKALQFMLAADTTDVDLLLFNGRYATNVVGLGYDASVADRAQYYKRFPLVRYLFAALYLIWKKPPRVPMRIEHEHGAWDGEFFIAVVGHTRKFARHVRIFNGLRIDGGVMKVAAFRPGPRLVCLMVLASAAVGFATAWPQATVAETDWVEITPGTTVKAQADGDLFYAPEGQTLRVELVRAALKVKTPLGNSR
jgi:diacylglycerol kinase family enzyme